MPPLSRLGYNAPMSANSMGMQAMPLVQPSFTPVDQVARAQTFNINSDFRAKYGTSTKDPSRPYADIGKMSLNLAKPGAFAENVPKAQGLIEGFGAGAGRLMGGFVGKPQEGADVGQFVGRIAQAPFDIAGAALGKVPAGGMGGGSLIPGSTLLSMTPDERNEAMKRWDGNPFTFMKAIGDIDREEFDTQLSKGAINPLFAPILRPAETMGDQVMNALGVTGIPSDLIQRGWAGGPGEAAKRIMETPEADLTPALLAVRERYADGDLTRDQFLDEIVVNMGGYSNNFALNFLGSALLDPANLAFGAGTAIGLSTKSAKLAQAFRFVDDLGGLGSEAAKGLVRSAAEQATLRGANIAEEAITPIQVFEEAQRLGSHGEQLAAAARGLPAHQRAALHPAFARMEKVADITQRVLDPFTSIGMRGTKPLENAYLSRESTKGVAQAYGVDQYSKLGDSMEEIGLGEVFNRGVGYFGAQEGVLLAGDNLRNDIQHVRKVSSARPTDVALARARVGAENYAFQMERWINKRKADLAMLTGGTKEEALARARTHVEDRLVRMGADQAQARAITRSLNEDGLSLVDAVYFGYRIETYNLAKKAAREALAAKVAAGKGGVASKAQLALQNKLDRATLIGPRELTAGRGALLREALEVGDIEAVRSAVRKYDRLAVEFLADGTDEQTLINGVRAWLDEFEDDLVVELSPDSLKGLDAMARDAAIDDGYLYGLRPEGEAEWRTVVEDGVVQRANPWFDIVGDAAEPWNLKFRDRNTRVSSFANALERKTRAIGRVITTDRIDMEARRTFTERAMIRHDTVAPGQVGTGLTFAEGRTLYQQVKDRALEASTTPRGMNIKEFQSIIDKNEAALRVGMSARDLQMLTLTAFEGNVGTVGLTQKLTGRLKVVGAEIPFLPENTLGQMAERMFPLVRFSLNPLFQLQEWVEPWVFSAARGRKAGLSGGWDVYDPVTQSTKHVGLHDVDLVQEHMIERYRAANPESQFDMMERSLVYLHGQKAAKEAAAATDMHAIRRALRAVANQSAGSRKAEAQSERFRDFLGPMLKRQFDAINPNIWLDLERTFGTSDMGTIAVRWMVEKNRWADADPRVAYHLMDATKEPSMGARAAVNLEENATRVFSSSREALNARVIDGSLPKSEFDDAMREIGAHQDYIDRTWKVMQFEAKTGGIEAWWDDVAAIVPGGAAEVTAVRAVTKALAEVAGISETELLSRTMQSSPVSLLHDDLIGATNSTLDAWGMLLQQQKDLVNYYHVDEATGAAGVTRIDTAEADARLLSIAANPPAFVPAEQVGQAGNMQQVAFRGATGEGRDLWIPGGEAALRDLETPWTAWEAHLIRSQVINPNDLADPVLKHALDEKMWRAHIIDMASTDPDAIARLFNNYTFAMHSAQMTLTRNEMVATRFRVSTLADLKALVAEAVAIRRTLERAGIKSTDADYASNLGLAYSTTPGVSHYIPLDDRLRHMGANMLPERIGPDGKRIRATQELVEERAVAASGYLEGTSQARRTVHRQVDELQEAHRATLPNAKAKKDYKPPGRIQHWGIEQLADALENGTKDAAGNTVRGIEAVEHLPAMLGVKRAAKFSDAEIAKITEAAGKLAENPLDLAAREVLAPYVSALKKMDDTIIFKPWNVNGAGLPQARMGRKVIGHGDHELFAYLKNDDVAWRSTATNQNMGRTLVMAEDMLANPHHYVRRRGAQYAPPPAVYDPKDYMDELDRLYYAVEDGTLSEAAAQAARHKLMEDRGVTVGRRYAPWGASHGSSGAMTGEAAHIMGIAGYDRAEDLATDAVRATESYLEGIAESRGSDMPLFSGQRVEGRPLPAVGSTVDLPLVATTADRSMAHGFSRSMDYRNKVPGYIVEFAPGTKATAHATDEFLTAGRFKVDSIEEVPYDTYYGTTGHPAAEPVQVVRMSQTEVFDPATKVYQPARPTAGLPEPARFGRDARGNATVPSQFKSEEGFVYRTVNQSRATSNWRVGEYVAKHPATIYAESDSSVVLRVRRNAMSWDEATGGVDASQNLQARGAVNAADVEMLGADGTWHPVLGEAERAMEPLDEFGERIAHRTSGLSLKTGFFGADLGDPLNFPKGVHDLHMVGDMTEWMYHVVRNRPGGQKEWDDWLASLSSGKGSKQEMIGNWIAKGAPKGAGVFKWGEAQGPSMRFIPGQRDAATLDGAGITERAAYVRRRIDEIVDNPKTPIGPEQRDRLLRQYRTDEELAELYGREIPVYGGDYKVFEDTMTRRKAEEAVDNPLLDRHGNGGYQWKLWDERRRIWDPETTAFATSHGLPRQDVRYYASSDDAHSLAGFYKNEGQPSIYDIDPETGGPVGKSILDPFNTVMPQQDGKVIRGATIMTDTGERIIGLTQYRNRSTFLHEITHAVIEPLLMDPSLKRVVWDDLNLKIDARNADVIERTATLRTQVEEAANIVAEHQNALIDAQARAATTSEARVATGKALTAAEREAKRLDGAVPVQQGVLKQLQQTAAGRRRDINAAKLAPSIKARRLEAVDRGLASAQQKLDDLITSRDAATAKLAPARDEVRLAEAAHAEAKQNVDIISTNLTARKAEGRALKTEYDEVATRAPEQRKFGWDRETSEYFADEFAKWLATGKAANPKLRDAFAYFRNVLIRIFKWSKDQPDGKVSPELEQLFNDLTNPAQEERALLANAVPFDATEEMMTAAGIQSVVDAEDAAFTNVQFRRKRSWLERSANHPYFGIYPASYMWGKVAPEMVRALAINPFGFPVPFLTKPVKINGVEYGLHGSPFAGFQNAARAQNSVELQESTDPEFAAFMKDPKNQKVFRNMAMFMPSTPWDSPANFPLWSRRIAQYGLEAQEAAAAGAVQPKMNVAKLGGEMASYAFGLKATFDWIDDTTESLGAPLFGGSTSGQQVTSRQLVVGPTGEITIEDRLSGAAAQLKTSLER